MTGFECYKMYISLKLHFSKEHYDFFMYKGKCTAKMGTFSKRNDKSFFYNIVHNYTDEEILSIFISNFISNPQSWIGEFIEEHCIKIYNDWRKVTQSLQYTFIQDMKHLRDYVDYRIMYNESSIDQSNKQRFKDLFKSLNGFPPHLFNIYKRNDIHIESFILLNEVIPFFNIFDRYTGIIPTWKEDKRICKKYKPFLNYNRDCIKKIVIDNLSFV